TTAVYLFALWYFWLERGFGHEARTAAEAWLAMDREGLDPMTRYGGLLAAGEILRFAGDAHVARPVMVEQAEIARAHPDATLHGWRNFLPNTLAALSGLNLHDGRLDEAQAQASEALVLRTVLGHGVGTAGAEAAVAAVLYARGDYTRSLELWESAARRLRTVR